MKPLCPKCGSDMEERRGRYGLFLGCSAFPACYGTRNSDGQPETTIQKFARWERGLRRGYYNNKKKAA